MSDDFVCKNHEVVAQKEEEDMPLIQWENRFSVGIRKLDQQHKGLVGMINELHDAMKAGKGQEVISEIVQRLAAYARNHF
ncbi:MAG TPA: hemerythrin domain-containing protein, partial [Acidobacteriota bacterium]|nr:hemerythrin domain-containing protein [Acidobacteriota bacterium]